MPQSKNDLIPLSQIPLSLTWEAMEKLVDGKLTRHIGVSNFSIEAIEKLNDGARIRPEMNQIEIHPYMQQDRLVDYCRDTGLLVTAYSPLGSRGNRVLKDPVVVAVAQKHDCTPAQAVLAWLMARDIVVIPKSVHEQRLRENFEATDVALDEDDMRRMASIERHERMSDGSFALFEDGPYTVYDLWGAGITADCGPQETIGISPAKPLCIAKDAIDLSPSVQSRPGKSRANSPFVLSALLSLRTSLGRPDGTAPGHFSVRGPPSEKHSYRSRVPIMPGHTVPLRAASSRPDFPSVKKRGRQKICRPRIRNGSASDRLRHPSPNRQTAASTPKRTCPILSRPTGCRRPPFRPRLPIPA